jgi:site-specific DNA recombinase
MARMIAVYCRVSTETQRESGLGLSDQETRCRAYVEAMGLVGEIRVFTDACSGGSLERPALSELVALVRRRKVAAVVALKIDRVARNLPNLLSLVEVFDRYATAFHSVTERVDTSGAVGRMVLQILGSVAQFERSQIAERTRAAIAVKLQRGDAHGFVPFGSENVAGKLREIESECETVDRIVSMRAEGRSLREIVAALEAEGRVTKRGGRWYAATVRKVLIGAEKRAAWKPQHAAL